VRTSDGAYAYVGIVSVRTASTNSTYVSSYTLDIIVWKP
jgi:hypothetical protein